MVDVTHSQTVGIFTVTCEHTVNKPVKEQHTETIKTQFWTDGDYALNKVAVVAEFSTGGSKSQLNERRGLMKMAHCPDNYYEQQKRATAVMAEQLGREDVQEMWTAFKQLPMHLRKVMLDMRHASARASKQSTFEVLQETNIAHGIFSKIIFLMNIETDKVTGNAWRNEIHAVKAFLDLCYNERVELHTVAHDSCSKTSTLITEYNIAMAARAAQEGTSFTPCIDANDAWHGTKSWKKLWSKIMTLFTKCVHKKSSGRAADDAMTIKQKKIAQAQLRSITKKMEGLLLQVCNASKDQPELSIAGFRSIIHNCFVADNHVYCEGASGPMCSCVVDKTVRAKLEQAGEAVQKPLCAKLLVSDQNPYLVDERIERQLEIQGCNECEKQPKKTKAQKRAEAEAELMAEAVLLTPEDLEGVEAAEAELDSDGKVFVEMFHADPYQPLNTQITHPLAIQALRAFQENKVAHSILKRHCHCVNTAHVESFHNALLKYCPKRKHFSKTYDARIYLAASDWQENITRGHIVTEPMLLKDGTWTKGGNKMQAPKTFKFQQRLLEATLKKIYWATPTEAVGQDYTIVAGKEESKKRKAEGYTEEELEVHRASLDALTEKAVARREESKKRKAAESIIRLASGL